MGWHGWKLSVRFGIVLVSLDLYIPNEMNRVGLTFAGSPDVDLHTANHLQAWISFSYKGKKPYMSVYLHTFEACGVAAQGVTMCREGQNL